jgi:hypothetical protein
LIDEPNDSGRTDDPDEEDLGPLEERLRRLEWPKPPPGMRERALEEFRRKHLAQDDAASGNGAAASNGHAEEADEPAAADPGEKPSR